METIDEIQEINALKKENKALKEAFANLSLKNLVLETYLEEFGKETGRTDEIKKKYAQELSKYFPNKKR